MKNSVIELDFKATKVWIENDYVCLRLEDDREIRFPVSKNKKLLSGTPSQIKKVELICNGTGLHWEELNEDLSVIGILDGRFDYP